MTPGDFVIIFAIVVLIWIVRAEGKAAAIRHEELIHRTDVLKRTLEAELKVRWARLGD